MAFLLSKLTICYIFFVPLEKVIFYVSRALRRNINNLTLFMFDKFLESPLSTAFSVLHTVHLKCGEL